MSGWYEIRARRQINAETQRDREKTNRHETLREDQKETLRKDQETEQTDSLRHSEAERLTDNNRC